jgi:hypothetical protein
MVGELELCLDYGATAATLARDMDVSVASDILYSIVPLVLPYSDTKSIRELLPQLTRLLHPIDREETDGDESAHADGADGADEAHQAGAADSADATALADAADDPEHPEQPGQTDAAGDPEQTA